MSTPATARPIEAMPAQRQSQRSENSIERREQRVLRDHGDVFLAPGARPKRIDHFRITHVRRVVAITRLDQQPKQRFGIQQRLRGADGNDDHLLGIQANRAPSLPRTPTTRKRRSPMRTFAPIASRPGKQLPCDVGADHDTAASRVSSPAGRNWPRASSNP